MPPRPHDADEPDEAGRDEADPDDAVHSAPGTSEPDVDPAHVRDTGAVDGDQDGGGDAQRATLDDVDVAARWAGIVSELSSTADPRAWAPDPDVEEAETHFTPPDPGPVLGGDPLLTMAWAAVVGVPLLLMVAVIAWRDVPTIVLQLAGVAFLAGVALLVWRMPRDREDDAGPGAVV
ncbi:hypothetical protein [Actinotalea fermentans]|uniref:DUF3040 domain-containing protein n=1 Tax=Actinotalea fermentans TaxID=43671 RepID=A0A511YU11_9CELL|nr:hypothetical protein [Actinotalea fermentans]GEN78688.1 hypothetical protein AFE02nite_04220 [Actinotalea fermentans]